MSRIPKLRCSIPREQVHRELASVLEAARLGPGFTLSWPAYMDERHRRSRRSFAEVRPGPVPAFAFADAVRRLPAANRWALYAHEVGHVLAPSGSEEDADAAAEAALGVRIGYDRRWPGKGLQVLENPGCSSGIRFGDGFCSPRGELDSEPPDFWAKGCPAEVVSAIGENVGAFTASDLGQRISCSESTARKYLKKLEAIRAVEGWHETSGIDRTGRYLYTVTPAGLDMSAWVNYRSGQGYRVSELAQGGDPLGIEAHVGAQVFDPWEWRDGRSWTYAIETIPPEDPNYDPWTFLAWSPEVEEYPIGELVMFASGHAAFDPRSFGKVGPGDYAPVARVRVHPAFRSMGVATKLFESAAQEAHKLGRSLGSSDARTPRQASWWAEQARRGRATRVRHRSRAHPEASRYVLRRPPPSSLSLGGQQAEVGEYVSESVPFNNPVPLENPCLPCWLFLL